MAGKDFDWFQISAINRLERKRAVRNEEKNETNETAISVETPGWRILQVKNWYYIEGTENVNDEVYRGAMPGPRPSETLGQGEELERHQERQQKHREPKQRQPCRDSFHPKNKSTEPGRRKHQEPGAHAAMLCRVTA